MSGDLFSKVLVLDNAPEHVEDIKCFCEANNLVPLKVRKDHLMSVLKTNIDLGAILYSESYGDTLEETAKIATEIHNIRAELPIIVRREFQATLEGLPESMQSDCCAAYVATDMDRLRTLIDEYIFSMFYPNELVRGIAEITEGVLVEQFKAALTEWEAPSYIVRDRIIFGEVFSLIPLESNWCRGYMMLQTEEEPILALLGRATPDDKDSSFRQVNSLLGEITNLIWGAFKNRYIGEASSVGASQIQVPLIVNHKNKYISFGTENPQLCFEYILRDPETGNKVTLYQRFIFNLSWSPEEFKEIQQNVDQLVDSGELELF